MQNYRKGYWTMSQNHQFAQKQVKYDLFHPCQMTFTEIQPNPTYHNSLVPSWLKGGGYILCWWMACFILGETCGHGDHLGTNIEVASLGFGFIECFMTTFVHTHPLAKLGQGFDFIECFTTTFLRAHSWLNWVDEDDDEHDEVGLKEKPEDTRYIKKITSK